jgi:hypothetical protein
LNHNARLGGISLDSLSSGSALASALAEELDTAVNPMYRPTNHHPLYRPLKAPRGTLHDTEWKRRDPAWFATPTPNKVRATCLTLTHPVLLDDDDAMKDIVKALAKVRTLVRARPW